MPSQAEEKSNSGSRSDDYGNRTHSQVEPKEDDGQSAIQEVLTRRPELEAKQYEYQTEADFSASIQAAIEKEHGVATTNTAASKGYEKINEGVQLGGDGTMQTVPGGNTDATGQGEHQKPTEEKPHQLRHDLAFFHAHHLLERAAEGREHVKIERNSRHSGIPGSDAHSSHDIEVQREPTTTGGVHGEEQNHQTVDNRTVQNLSRPGAYMAGGPGGALPRRADSARLSLFVADPTDAPPQDDPRNINARSGQLAVANIVYEDPEQHARPSANPVNLQAILQREQQRKKQQKTFWFILVLILLGAATIVGTVAGAQKEANSSNMQTPAPTSGGSMGPSEVPSSAPTGALDSTRLNLPNFTLESLQEYGTPQWLAWDWLSNHQNITNLPEWRKTQLFAMATFYHSFEGVHWPKPVKDRWMDDMVDECLWFSSGVGYFANGVYEEEDREYWKAPCDEHGRFISLLLEDLDLTGLSPSFPPEMTLLTSLQTLGLAWNGLNMTLSTLLSPTVYDLTGLTFLQLDNNPFTGELPSELGCLTALTSLSLDFNSLTGPIATELALLPSLVELDLNGNYLTGEIISELGVLSGLERLTLSDNQLSGALPSELGLLTASTFITFFFNDFTGSVPSELGMLTQMEKLWLDRCNLSGTLPSELWQLTNMERLHLSENMFTGTLPREIGYLDAAWEVLLEKNQFSGTIPIEVAAMESLEKLYLNDNDLTGTIPNEFNASVVLRLDGNNFSGIVPEQLCPVLSCDCSTNMTLVSTCVYLEELPAWPGRFPAAHEDATAVMLNVHTDWWPEDMEWIWQRESSEKDVWEDLDGGTFQVQEYIYSFNLEVLPNARYNLALLEWYGDGFTNSGWLSVTASNETVLYSLDTNVPFTEINIEVLTSADGVVEARPNLYCDPAFDQC